MNWARRRFRLDPDFLRNLTGVSASLLLRLPSWKPIDTLIGALARITQPQPLARALADLGIPTLAQMARAGGARGVLALARTDEDVAPNDLIDVVDDKRLVQSAARLLVLHPDAAARSTALYNATLSPVEAGPDRLATALSAVARIAETLQTSHAISILRQSLLLASQPIDPYEPPGLHVLARQAAAAIVAEHPELDPQLHEMLRESPGRAAIEVIASGLHVRRSGSSVAVADALAAWRPERQHARSFLRMIDARFEAGPVRPVSSKPSLFRPMASRAAVIAAALLMPPVTSAASALVATRTLHMDPPAQPSLTAALGVLGVLFAVDIYTSEQSAVRLPGVLARYASRARSLLVAYSSAFTLIGAVVAARFWPDTMRESAWTATVAAGVFVGAAAFLLRAVVARLDPANAASAFVRNRGWAMTWGGLALGKIRREALEVRKLIAGLRPVRLVSSPVSSEWRHRITPDERGFLLPRSRALRRLAKGEPWGQGSLVLNMAQSIGTIVRAREEVASVTSDEETVPTTRELRAAERSISVRSARLVDAVSEAAAGLVGLAGDLLKSGDHQAADRVGQSLVELLSLHLGGVHRQPPPGNEEVSPVIPPLITALGALVEHAAAESRGRSVELLLGLIDDILQLTRADDHAPALLQFETSSARASAHVSSELLRLASRRALEFKDESTMALIRQDLARQIASGSPNHLQTAADVSALAMWLDYFGASRYWSWLMAMLDLTTANHLRVAVRVGAAALEARIFSVALDVAQDLLSADASNVGTVSRLAEDSGFISWEKLRAELGGGYLGDSPGDAIQRFAVFTETAAPAIDG